ncbi:polysaccharide deacetylase family protein [Desulfonema magnum]|uniref:Polysaccharide deacetylase domain-containing protein n=1 Tax=Desulfonema magnum TaxID=45655 RepID=A0A975GQG7_9BACT|nr:polysaccharide deacetylase family protein [Desulfonema magnum]QTA90026.1 Polysaccharide deacetylase domain-containing protein [Desulfonema magnum]
MYKQKFIRKLNAIRCFLIRTMQKKRNNKDFAYITIFHDYEGDYAGRGLKKISHKGVNTILDIEARYKIKATYNIVGKLMNEVPEVVSRILSDGHEIASHSYNHSIMTMLSKKEIISDIIHTKENFKSIGIELKGFRSPQSKWNFKQMSVLLNQGLYWSAEGDNANFPYIIKKKQNRYLVRMPVIIDDWSYQSMNITPDAMLQKLQKCVDEICKEKKYGAIGFHPWVQGKDNSRLIVFEEFIAGLSERKDVKILPFDFMYNYFLSCLNINYDDITT